MGIEHLHTPSSQGIAEIDRLLIDRAALETIGRRGSFRREGLIDHNEISTLGFCLLPHPHDQLKMPALIAPLRESSVPRLRHVPGEGLSGIG